VVLDHHSAGKIGNEQVRVFNVDPGEHRLRMRFVLLRRSKEMRMSLKEDVEREFISGTSGIGWPTLREASPEDLAEIRGSSIGEPPKPGGPVSPNCAECRDSLVTITRRPRQPRTDDQGRWRGVSGGRVRV
jgi:hypothetical protein